jgi:hypothetical protein
MKIVDEVSDIGNLFIDDSDEYIPDDVTSDSSENNYKPQKKKEENFQLQEPLICHSKGTASNLPNQTVPTV